MSVNRVVLIGRLTKDVEVKKTQNGLSVASFTLACNRQRKEDPADFINCTVWRQGADFLGQYAKKGNTVSVDGRMQSRSYDDANGKKVYVTEVVADNVTIVNGGGSASVNNVVLLGRLTKDVDVRKTGNDLAVASFTLACDRQRKDDPADFISCVAWRQSAEFLGQYSKKGNLVAVEGRIQTRSYDDAEGKKVYVTEVVANSAKLFGNKSDDQTANASKAGSKDDDDKDEVVVPEIEISSDDLPF